MKLTLYSLFLSSVMFTACKDAKQSIPDGYKLQDFGTFSIVTPDSWDVGPYPNSITDGTDVLVIDMGLYSPSFSSESRETHTLEDITIHGRKAVLLRPKEKGDGRIGVHIPQVYTNNDKLRFSIDGKNLQNEDVAVDIFTSIRFASKKQKSLVKG